MGKRDGSKFLIALDAEAKFFSSRTARYMNLYLNDQDIRSLNQMDTPISETDVLSIVFAVADG
jgi:hypothetical protein